MVGKKNMKNFIKVLVGAVLALPMAAFAQAAVVTTRNVNSSYLSGVITAVKGLLDQLIVLLIALAVVWFIWNVIKYAMSSDEEGKKKAKDQMIWGIIAIAVIVSIWGLVAILQNMFGVGTGTVIAPGSLLPVGDTLPE